ncbi:MAG: hypothetical protein AAF684_09595 [Pseudomonadota bacterium]
MEWLMALFGPAGGLAGLLGGALSQWLKTRALREQRAHERAMLELQMRAAEQETENALEIAESEGRWAAMERSYSAAAAADASRSTSTWVADVRSLTRPVLTFVLVGLSAGVAWVYRDSAAVEDYVTTAILFMTTTAVGWWFGERGMQPRWAK